MTDISKIKSRLSRINYYRKRIRQNRKLERRFRGFLAQDRSPTLSQISDALAMLRPQAIEIPLVRIGPENDGGYVLPDDMEGLNALFSPGVSDEIGFDREISARGIECFMADASVEAPGDLPPNIHFRPNFIGSEDRHPFITMQSWVEEEAPGRTDLMLQMDIEGAEYDVLDNLPAEVLARFRIIVLELHDLEWLAEPAWLKRFTNVLSRLNANHTLCHLHSNNTGGFFYFEGRSIPQVVELSYVRADRTNRTGDTAHIPHPLDQLNSYKLPEFPHSHFWQAKDLNC